MNVFVIHPDEPEVLGAVLNKLNELQTVANHRQRNRTAWLDTREVVSGIRESDSGIITATGGGVPNSYRQRAETTVVGVAWFTDAEGQKHVRVLAHRTAAPKSPFGRKDPVVFGTESPIVAVYPDLGVTTMKQKDRTKGGKILATMIETLAAAPLDMATRAALADHLEELGATPRGVYQSAAWHRTALEFIRNNIAIKVMA